LSDTVGVNVLYCLPGIVVEEVLLVIIKMYLNFTSFQSAFSAVIISRLLHDTYSIVTAFYKLLEIQPYFRTESSAYHILLKCDI